MRRTLQINLHTTIIILFVVSWLSCTSVQGFPAASRAGSGESMSTRRRGGDDLIVGSDFLNMFIGAKVDPSVRSRRYPLVRSDIVDPRQGHSPDSESRTPSRQLRPPSEGQNLEDHNRRRTYYVDPNESLSGLIKSQDRQNYRFETQDPHSSNKVDHLEDLQRRGGIRFKYVHPINRLQEDHLSGVTEDAVVRNVMASEARVFGGRTLPRTSSNAPSSVTTSVAPSVAEEVTDNNYSTGNSNDHHRVSTESDELNSSEKRDTHEGHTLTNVASEVIDTQNDRTVSKLAVPPKFSVSSSVKKIITKENENHKSQNLQNNQSPHLNNEATTTSPNFQLVTESSTSEESQTTQMQDDLTSSMSSFQTSTEANAFSTEDESTTFTAVTDSDLSSERNEDWSTKSDDVTPEQTVTANVEEIPDGAQFQKIGIPQDSQESAVKVVSVRVSSSVAQVPSSVSLLKDEPVKKNPGFNTISEEPPSSEGQVSSKSHSNSLTLETEDHPPVTSVQRSEFVVEELSPTEVTAIPYTSYTSFFPSKFQSPSTIYYQAPLDQTSSNPEVVQVGYQSSQTSAKTERRVQYFNHPPRNHRNPTFEALQRSSDDSPSQLNGYVKATVQDVSPRRYAPHSLPRTQDSTFQSLRQEPASVAESIQRSIITRHDADRSETRSVSSRSQFHQDKNGYVSGGFQGIDERGSFTEEKPKEETRERKRYSQPERVWGEPEKVYGEPEKVYGEPEKVYGKPEQVYGEPEKVYGEPEKAYGEPEKVYGEPEKNYEVDEAVSVLTNGRAHGIQPTQGSTLPTAQVDSALKMIDSKQQDPNHKFGYVVEGRNFRKYRVEERTSDGFIVGEYGVVSHDDGSLRGVRYTADDTINPRLIYDTLVKFLSL